MTASAYNNTSNARINNFLPTKKNNIEEMKNMKVFSNENNEVIKYALSKCEPEGSFCEFGLLRQEVLPVLLNNVNQKVHSFDSLKIITPQLYPFNQSHYTINDFDAKDNLVIHKGWFEETIPAFVNSYDDNISFLHVECDLSSTTKTIFQYLDKKIVKGTVLVFDQFFNYQSPDYHEQTAFQEFVNDRKIKFEFLCGDSSEIFGSQIALKITDIH